MPEDNVIVTLRKTRKAFLPEYLCGAFLLSLLLIAEVRHFEAPSATSRIIIGLALLSFMSAEVTRLRKRYKIKEEKLMIIDGFVKQSTKNIYFYSLSFVPDLNIDQSAWQRFLNFGTVYIRSGSEDSFAIKDVDNPQNIMELIEELIEKNKKEL
ncbi:PH domain-containing protein [Candidatus Woesearchaeota archaeon]|nr:PH domain-containing protein [Candidatus Woesearchaeota archaeon]